MEYQDYYERALKYHYSEKEHYNKHDQFFVKKMENPNANLPHLVHADSLEEDGLENIAKHIRHATENTIEKGSPASFTWREDNHFGAKSSAKPLPTLSVKSRFISGDSLGSTPFHSVELTHASPITYDSERYPATTFRQPVVKYIKTFHSKEDADNHLAALQQEIESQGLHESTA